MANTTPTDEQVEQVRSSTSEQISQVDATDRMLAWHKARHASKVANGEDVPAGELLAITKLEVTVENLRRFARLRDMTRRVVDP